MEEERVRLERQVEAREEEITRLGRQIGSDGNLEKVRLAFILLYSTRARQHPPYTALNAWLNAMQLGVVDRSSCIACSDTATPQLGKPICRAYECGTVEYRVRKTSTPRHHNHRIVLTNK